MKHARYLRLYPDPVLRHRAAPVKRIDGRIIRLLREMERALRGSDGIGLAAPQLGVPLRVILLDAAGELVPLINPEIIGRSGEHVLPEGCLSIPNVRSDAPRHESITLRAIDSRGKTIERRFDGLESRIVQHLCDHLDGILIIDHNRNSTTDFQERIT